MRCQTGCDRPTVGEMLYYTADGVTGLPLCEKHLAVAREAAVLLGGEPVWHMSKWMDLTGRGGRLRQALTRKSPRVFEEDEIPPLATGEGYVAPLLDGQAEGRVTVLATDRRIVGVVRGRIKIEWRWDSVRRWTTRETAFPDEQREPYEVFDVSFSPSGGGYTLLIKPQDKPAWDATLRRMAP